MRFVRIVTAGLGICCAFVGSDANARVISATNGTITIHSGAKTGLQQAFAWDRLCKTVPIAFSGRASAGNLVKVGGRFSVGSGRCAGHRVNGFTVVYVAPSNFHGSTTVQYSLKAANVRDTYSFTRRMIVR